jgi:hypothetical protein
MVSQGSDAKTVALLVIGVVLLIAGGINEMFTKRSAIIPARLLKVSCHSGWSTVCFTSHSRLAPLASFSSPFSFRPRSSLESHSE